MGPQCGASVDTEALVHIVEVALDGAHADAELRGHAERMPPRLAELRPGEHVLGEEEGGAAGIRSGELTWVLDPIDGTVNFVYGI